MLEDLSLPHVSLPSSEHSMLIAQAAAASFLLGSTTLGNGSVETDDHLVPEWAVVELTGGDFS